MKKINFLNSVAQQFWVGAKRVATVDLRSLAALRISMGFVTALDLVDRWVDLSTFYTDSGVLSRGALIENYESLKLIDFHLMNGSWNFQCILFGLNLLLNLALLLGFQTRIVTVLVWAFSLSLHARQPQVAYGVDNLIRAVLMWGVFLPWEAKWSIDAWSAGRTTQHRLDQPNLSQSGVYTSGSVLGLYLQLAIVYVATAVAKCREPIWLRGMGVYHALTVDAYSTAFGDWLSHQVSLLKIVNYCVLFFRGHRSPPPF